MKSFVLLSGNINHYLLDDLAEIEDMRGIFLQNLKSTIHYKDMDLQLIYYYESPVILNDDSKDKMTFNCYGYVIFENLETNKLIALPYKEVYDLLK